jgi:hypothetical protein
MPRLFVVNGCHSCPNIVVERTPRAGCAEDYYCTAVRPRRKVDGYIEWDSEKRKDGDFPKFCPLPKAK